MAKTETKGAALSRVAAHLARTHGLDTVLIQAFHGETEDATGNAEAIFAVGVHNPRPAYTEAFVRIGLEVIERELAAETCDCPTCNERLDRVRGALACLTVPGQTGPDPKGMH